MRLSSFLRVLACVVLGIGLNVACGEKSWAQKPEKCQEPDVKCESAQIAFATGEKIFGYLLEKATLGGFSTYQVLTDAKELQDKRYDDIRTISVSSKDLIFSLATLDKFTVVKEILRREIQILEGLRENYFFENTGDVLFPVPEREQIQSAETKMGTTNRRYNAQLEVSIKENVRGAGSKILLQVDNVRIRPDSIGSKFTILTSSFVTKLSVSVAGAGGSIIEDWSTITEGKDYIFDVSDLREIKGKLSELPVYVSITVREKSFLEGVGPGEFDDLPFVGRFRFSPGNTEFPPSKPALTASSGRNKISLSLSGKNVDRYRIYRSTDSGFSVDTLDALATTSSTSYTDEGLVAGRKYYYKAVAVSSNGRTSNSSNQVSGQLETNYRIKIDDEDLERNAYSQGTLSGTVETIGGNPVSEASVSLTIPEIELTVDEVQTDANGQFSIPYRAPGVPDGYSLQILARPEGKRRIRNVGLTVTDRPEWGRDLKISRPFPNDSLAEPGGTLQTVTGVKNQGTENEEASIQYQLLNRSGTGVKTIRRNTSLGPNEAQSISTDLALPSDLDPGSYQLQASVENADSLDREQSNNTGTSDIYAISSPYSTSTYRTLRDTIEEGTTKTIDGTPVTLVTLSSTSVEFEVDGERTGSIPLGGKPLPPWENSSEDFLLLRDRIETTDTTASFLAGAQTPKASVSPERLHEKRGLENTFEVQLPEGQSPDPSTMTVPYGADADTLESWMDGTENERVDSRTAALGLRVPPTAELRDYEGWLEWDGETYTYYKKVAVRPRPIHDIALANVQAQSTIEGGQQDIPDFIPGAPVQISGRVENRGDFHEREILEAKIENDDGKVVYTEHDTLTLAARDTVSEIGEATSFSFTWPTVGLEPGTYNLSVQAVHSADDTPNDNRYGRTIDLQKPPTVDIEIQKANAPFEVGDQISLQAFVGRKSQSFSEASVSATLIKPNGETEGLSLTYDSQFDFYETSFYANYGGNYRVELQAERAPYRPNEAESLFAKTYVDVSTSLSDTTVDVGKARTVRVQTSNVGGLYGFSADVVYQQDKVGFSRAAESAFLNEGGDVRTTLQREDRGGRVVTGVTRLNSEQGGITSTRGGRLVSLAFTGRAAGDAPFTLENVNLIDPEGKAMATRVVSDGDVLTVEEEPAAASVSVQDTVSMGTVRDTARITLTNAFRTEAFDGTISYPASQMRVVDVVEGSVFNEQGDVETVFAQNIDQENGTVQFSVSRTGDRPGISVGSDHIARLIYEPKASGSVPLSLEEGTIISSYENLSLPSFSQNDTLVVTGEDDPALTETRVGLAPDTAQVAQGDTISAAITVSDVSDLYSVASDLTFDTGQLTFAGVRKDGFLSGKDGVRTSLTHEVGEDTVVVGLSRLDEEDGGASTTGTDTLYTVFFRRSGTDPTEVEIADLGLLRPDGSTTIPATVDSTLAVSESEPDSSETTLASIDLAPDTAEVVQGDTVSAAITVSDVSNLYSFASDLTFETSQLDFAGIRKEGFLSGEEGVRTSLTHEVREDTIVVGLSRLDEEAGGAGTTGTDTLCTVFFRRSGTDPTEVEVADLGLLQSDGSTKIPATIDSTLEVAESQARESSTATLAFSPARTEVGQDSSFTVAVTIDDVDNLFSVATDVTYDPSQLTLDAVTEGNFLGEDSVNTSLTVQIDNQSGIATIGLSRLGDDVGGVSTSDRDTLLTAAFTREDTELTELRLVNTGLLEPDGSTRIPFTAEEGIVLNAPPSPPSALTADSTGGNIQIHWTGVDISDLGRYRIYRDTAPIDSVSGPAAQMPLDSTVLGDTTYTDTTVNSGTTYYYRVTAVDTSASESGFSNQASAQIPLSGIALIDGRDGMDYQPPMPEPGTEENPVGRFVLKADRNSSLLSRLTIDNDAETTQGVNTIELWQSTDPTFSGSEDSLVSSDSSIAPTAFENIGLSIPNDSLYIFLVLDLNQEARGNYNPVIRSGDALTLAGGNLEFVNGEASSSFTDAYLSTGATPLPVELASFDVRLSDETAALTWTTASETNNAGFAVQHRADSTGQWKKRGFVESKAEGGTTTETTNYRFETDELEVGPHQFRLRQLDVDGTAHLSDPITVQVRMEAAYRLSAFPNPTRRQATVKWAVREKQEVRLVLYDVLGRQVAMLHDGWVPAQEVKTLTLDARREELSNGTYFLRLVGEDGTRTSQLTIVR